MCNTGSCGLAEDGRDYGSGSLGGVKGLAAGVRWLVPFRCCAPKSLFSGLARSG